MPTKKPTVAHGKLLLELFFLENPQEVNVKPSISLGALRINVIV
jgi:hypothetical protein